MAQTSYTVERSETMRADAERIFAELSDFHRWPAWSPWEDLDPAMHRTYAGPERGTGAVYEWSGNRKAGEGRMEITSAHQQGRRGTVVIDLRFRKPMRSSNVTTFLLEPADEDTRVTWRMVGPQTLGTRVMGLVTRMDQLVGKDFAKGLERLRRLVEKPAA